jgi:hypothetical protein
VTSQGHPCGEFKRALERGPRVAEAAARADTRTSRPSGSTTTVTWLEVRRGVLNQAEIVAVGGAEAVRRHATAATSAARESPSSVSYVGAVSSSGDPAASVELDAVVEESQGLLAVATPRDRTGARLSLRRTDGRRSLSRCRRLSPQSSDR